VVIALSSPLHVGIYENECLIDSYSMQEQTSESLPYVFATLLERYEPKGLFFARGPGSFMSIKIAYIFLKTMSISLGIPLYATDGFTFNEGKPIKAMRQRYFVKENGNITTRLFESPQESFFSLPNVLLKEVFDSNAEPLYMLPAV
jgi:tRNA threonylcarbamoyladenosine biosynthesis protein TsaB